MQLWGNQNEAQLPRLELPSTGMIQNGQEIVVKVLYAPTRVGRFENHWVCTMDAKGSGRALFGSPLLVETVVEER